MQDLLAAAEFFCLTVDASVASDNADYLNVESRLWCDGELHLLFLCLQPGGQDCSAAAQEKTLLHALASADVANVTVEDCKSKLVESTPVLQATIQIILMLRRGFGVESADLAWWSSHQQRWPPTCFYSPPLLHLQRLLKPMHARVFSLAQQQSSLGQGVADT